MDLEKWKHIIIDWVNCLKLYENVRNLEDLKNGVFFKKILKLITSGTFLGNESALPLVITFLKEQYPNILFSCQSDQLQDLKSDNIIIICSLFLHYSCICDGRTDFTFPLCQHLSRETQICIRTFLENITTRSTIDRVFDAIQSAVKKSIKSKYIYTNASLNTTIGCSPLQELLNISSSQLIILENLNNAINELEVDNSIEEDLLPAYNVNCEENDNLEDEFDDFNIEEDVKDLNYKIDYNLYHGNVNNLQQVLRSQVNELEECFQNLQSEQVHLQKEKVVLQQRIEKLQSLKVESTNQLGSNQEDNELNKIYLTLMELTALIDAVQELNSTVNPISLILNNTGVHQHSVKNVLESSLENACNLKKTIEVFYETYGKLEDEYVNVKKINEEYAIQVSMFCHSQKELDYVRAELETSAVELISFLKQCDCCCNLNKLEEQFYMSKNKIENLLKNFDDLLNEPIDIVCETNDCNINTFDEEIFVIEIQYEQLLNSYNEKSFFLASITSSFNNVENKLETSLRTLESLFNNSSDLMNLNFFNMDTFDTINFSKDVVVTLQELITKLNLNVMVCRDKAVISINEFQILNNDLQAALLQVPFLEELILKNIRNVSVLDYNIFEITVTINELQMMKDAVIWNNNKSGLNLKLFKYLHKLDEDKVTLDNLHKSIDALEEIKTDIDSKVRTLENKLLEDANCQSEILELQALGCVFEEEIFRKIEESVLRKETVDDLEVNVDVLRHQLLQMKNSCISDAKQNNKNVVRRFQEDIKTINSEIKYCQISINGFELNLQILQAGLTEAEQDMTKLIEIKKMLIDIIKDTKNHFEKRLLILNNTSNNIDKNITNLYKEETELKLEIKEKWTEYNNLKKQKDCTICEYNRVQFEMNELAEKLNNLESQWQNKDDLVLLKNYDFLDLSLNVKDKLNYLNTIQDSLAEVNNTRASYEDEWTTLQEKDRAIKENVKILNTKHIILANLKQTVEEDYSSGDLLNLYTLESDLAQEEEELQQIIRNYKKLQEDVEMKMAYFKPALFENLTEFQNLVKRHSVMGNYNINKITQIYDKVSEMSMQMISKNKEFQGCVKNLNANIEKLHAESETYIASLESNYDTNVNHGLQLKMLKQNLCKVVERNKIVDTVHEATINKLEIEQSQVERLECQKLEFETQLLRQNNYFEEEYEKNVTNLNSKIKELDQKQYEMKEKLAKNINELQESNWSNNELYNEFNVMHAEFASLNDDKDYVGKKLENIDCFCRGLKEDVDCFSNDRLKMLKENCQKMTQLQNDLSKHVEMLMSENSNLKTSINHLQNYVFVLQCDRDDMEKTRMETLKNKENEKMILEKINKCNQDHINDLIKEKELLEMNILEEAKYVEDSDFDYVVLLSAKDIFEVGQQILEEEFKDTLKKIQDIDYDILQNTSLFQEKLENKERNIKDILTKIKLLQIELGENSSKNNKLLLELCTVNAAISSLSKQYTKLKQTLNNKPEESNIIETAPINSNTLIQNIQLKSNTVSKNIILAKEEIEQLKKALKNYFLERQALDLESQVINEKISQHEHYLKKDKTFISELNSQLFEKINNISKLRTYKLTLQNRLKVLSLTLKNVKEERSNIVDSRVNIFVDTEDNVMRIHENTVEIYGNLLNNIGYLDKDENLQEKIKNDIEKLIEGEKVAKEMLYTKMLEICNERIDASILTFINKHNS